MYKKPKVSFPIGVKLLFGAVFTLILLSAFGTYMMTVSTKIRSSFELLDQRRLATQEIVSLQNIISLNERYLDSYLDTGDRSYLDLYESNSNELGIRFEHLRDIFKQVDHASLIGEYEDIFKDSRATEREVLAQIQIEQDQEARLLFQSTYENALEEERAAIEKIRRRNEEVTSSIVQQSRILVIISTNILLVLLVILVISVTSVSIAIAYSLTKSIRSFGETVDSIIGGDLSRRVQIKTRDELGELAAGFNFMTDKLEELYRSLEHRVEEKTIQLRETVSALKKTNTLLEGQRQQLAKDKAQDDAILKSIGDGMIVTDPDRNVVFINNQAKEMLKVSDQDCNHCYIFSLFSVIDENGNTVPVDERPILQALHTKKKIVNGNIWYQRRDGSTFPVLVTSTPVMHKNSVLGMIVIFRDITHEKSVSRAKTEFVSLASHQLRTPLTTIRWNTEMLLEDTEGIPQERVEMLSDVLESSKHMIGLVDALLNVSRLDLGTFTILPESIDLRDIVKGVVSEFESLIKQKNLKLREVFPNHMNLAMVDPDLTRILFQNLISNATKYTPENGVIEVSLKEDEKGVVFAVKDQGVGISKKDQDHIFEKLFRSKAVEREQGHGLGLYMVKQIIDESGCEIWFESEEGVGTSFYIRIPTYGMKKKSGTKKLKVMYGEEAARNRYAI